MGLYGCVATNPLYAMEELVCREHVFLPAQLAYYSDWHGSSGESLICTGKVTGGNWE